VAFARVSCTEFEVRNEWQKQNIIAIFKFFSSFLTVITLVLQTHIEKITSNAAAIFQFSFFFQKVKHFYAFWSKFLLIRNVF